LIYSNAYSGIFVGQNGATNVVYVIYGNIVYSNNSSNTQNGISELTKGAGTISLSIYNNTVYQNGNTSQQEIKLEDDIETLNIKNNIFNATDTRRTISSVAQTGSVSIDNNIHWRTDGDPSIYYNGDVRTWATWQGYGFDTNGINDNPDFTTPGSDFTLDPASPAIDAGVDLGTGADWEVFADASALPPNTPTLVDQDSVNAPWDIGAFGGYAAP
jgi:hypothetical protein